MIWPTRLSFLLILCALLNATPVGAGPYTEAEVIRRFGLGVETSTACRSAAATDRNLTSQACLDFAEWANREFPHLFERLKSIVATSPTVSRQYQQYLDNLDALLRYGELAEPVEQPKVKYGFKL